MKSLTCYTNKLQEAAFKTAGSFFCFSNSSFDEQKVEGVTYTNMGGGLICPADQATWLNNELNTIHSNGIKQDIEENGVKGIIGRELSNHEAFYTYDIDSTVDALAGYNISKEDIQAVFETLQCEQ